MRPMTAEEETEFAEFVDMWGPGVADAWRKAGVGAWWVHGEGHRRRVFLVAPALAERLKALTGRPPEHAGVHLGDWRPEGIRWSLEGAAYLARWARRRRVRVRAKAAQLFLYGKMILGLGVARADAGTARGDVVLVLTEGGDCLGLGRVVGPMRGNAEAVEPIVDRGWYLREGG